MKKLLLPSLFSLFVTSTLAGEWDYPNNRVLITNDSEALNYVSQRYADIGSFRLRYTKDSKLGKHYNFDVMVDGENKQQRTIVLSIDNDQRVARIFKSLEDTVIRNGITTTAVELENPRRLVALEPPSLASGVIKDVNVNIFDPDLRTMDKIPQPDTLWKDLSEYPHSIRYVSRPISLLESGGRLFLANERVHQVDAKELSEKNLTTGTWETSSTSTFLSQEGIVSFSSVDALQAITYDMPEFSQIMAFYHLDKSLSYLLSLGSNLFPDPIRFDARGLAKDNSAYYFGPKSIMFGIGGSPDAIDADVVLHELGHGIHYQIVPDWGYGHTGAIGEGFGDYWAGAYSYQIQHKNSEAFELDIFSNWDGLFGFKKRTRSLWNQRAKYFEHSEYRAHEFVGGELGDELWSTPLFQSLKQSVAKYGDSAFSEFDTIVLQSMYGLGRGMKMHDLAESMIYVARKLYQGKDYAQILQQNFKLHGLLKEPFQLMNTPKFVDTSKHFEVQLQHKRTFFKIDGTLKNDLSQDTHFSDTSLSQQTIRTPHLSNGVCGKPFGASIDLQYQIASDQIQQSWQHSHSFVYGLPKFNTPIKTINASIPDADVSNNLGIKSFSREVYSEKTITDNLGVYFEIEHQELADLQLKLISPDNVVVRIHPHEFSNNGRFKRYFVAGLSNELDDLVGTSMYGIWKLEVTDFKHRDTGTLVKWGVSEISEYQCGKTTTNSNNTPSNAQSSGGGTTSLLGLLILFAGALLRNRNLYKRIL